MIDEDRGRVSRKQNSKNVFEKRTSRENKTQKTFVRNKKVEKTKNVIHRAK